MSTVVGVFRNQQAASAAIEAMRGAGVNTDDISYVSTQEHDLLDKSGAGEVGKDTAGGASSGAIAGGALGTIAGLAVANGILPGLGTLFFAGPIATGLGLTGAAATTAAGALSGAAAGGLVGALTGMGIGASDAQKYEDRVKSGDVLVTVRTDDTTATQVMFTQHGAEDIAVY